ncbi:Inosine triphosphate pyrophosphatase [Talaromyces islandicus]|uniref:Inosine triphosphate pyrophosphatase n=1 Tax=Talaromyces islandicus TaxID=28573 RepID=A0A0U1LJX6_TALIS|nr:Inosine triphosphate pyrophosphatase [Talaromyces islandicus]
MANFVFVTGNKHKISEIRAIFNGDVSFETKFVDLPEIQGTVEEITREKCRVAAEQVGGAVLVEDSALEMHALNGLPGPYVKDFVELLGNEGLCKLLTPYEDKTAEAVCTVGYCAGPGSEPVLFQGRLVGQVVPERGWEPIFQFQGDTLAEMSHLKKVKKPSDLATFPAAD